MLAADGSYHRPNLPEGAKPFSCHRFFMQNPSLSGRGRHGTDATIRHVLDEGDAA